MCRTKIRYVLAAAAIVAVSSGFANAQTSGWSARAAAGGRASAGAPVAGAARDAGAQRAGRGRSLVGTWRVAIPQSDAGLAPFNAYQTFHTNGTFTEVSDLLTTQTESPAHGAWSGKRSDYELTFELFVFDPETKQPAGRVRVRAAIRLSDDGNSFTADSVVDFIAPDGTVFEAVDSGPFSGTRVEVVPVNGA